jgi:hypothetical protein
MRAVWLQILRSHSWLARREYGQVRARRWDWWQVFFYLVNKSFSLDGQVLINVLAFLCSICHYVLFLLLNGDVADGRFAIPQSYVTATSLILAALFRASLLGSVGICFAQILWRLLRDRPLPVSGIESILQMRSNPLELFDTSVVRRATALSLVALYMWIVPLAVTFPPGALTIAATEFKISETLNVSVINPSLPKDLDPSSSKMEGFVKPMGLFWELR